MQNYLYIASYIILISLSCNSEDKIRTYRLPKKLNEVPALVEEKKVSSKTIDETKKFTLQWQAPESWEQFDGHSMRMASFYVPHSVGKGELSITEFSGMSGGIQANINRWRGQVSLPPQSEQSIIDASITYNSDLGKFLFFELSNEKTNQCILASIYELTNSTVFVKLSIEHSAILEVKKDFLTFSESFSL